MLIMIKLKMSLHIFGRVKTNESNNKQIVFILAQISL